MDSPGSPGERDSSKDTAQRHQDMPARHSPAPPLAPLEYLQNQRRGSITDPILHAANPSPSSQIHHHGTSPNTSSTSTQFRQQEQPLSAHSHLSAPSDAQSKGSSLSTRPVSPYIFGEASVQPTDSSYRRLLPHSSGRRGSATFLNTETGSGAHKGEEHAESSQARNTQTSKRGHDQGMDIDSSEASKAASRKAPIELVTTGAPEDGPNFDYNMRRHSVPGGEHRRSSQGSANQSRVSPISPTSHHGSKRKMSIDRAMLPSVGEEIDPQLIGPGSHSNVPADPDEPANKRRNSAFDTQRIAQLSIYDRRDSMDSRMSATPSWWSSDRRDSASSMLSSTSMGSSSVGFNSPAFSGDMHGRQPGSMSAFAWPPTVGPNDTPIPPGPSGQGEVDPNFSRTYDAPIPPHSTISSDMPLDRRLSVPDAMPSSSTSRPSRTLRSRSRPPSRSTAAGRGNDDIPPGVADALSAGFEKKSDDSPTTTSPGTSPLEKRDMGSTPYSRSPELRVSHKLAERKRRKEMRDLFDELRDQLPADRGMKASKWEILSKSIDFVHQLKQSHQEMSREIEMLRHELEAVRHGGLPFAHPGGPHAVVYGHGPPPVGSQFPPPGPPLPSQQQQSSGSRPGSSQTSFPANAGQAPVTNGK